MLLSGWLAIAVLKSPVFDFYSLGSYDSAVPRPESVLGYRIGSRHTTYREQEQVVDRIAAAAPGRVKKIEFGKSPEGRPLRIFVVSTKENMAQLEKIRLANLAVSQGKPSPMANPPAIVWVNECIHGDETASFESAMPLLYNLAASRSMDAYLKNAVVIVNPSYNPDGHERYIVVNNSTAVGSPERESFEATQPSAYMGRTNHYRFDMNRDRVAMSQDETRQEVAEFLKWRPHVYIDQHGQVSSYFFPPNQMAINENVDRERMDKWTKYFGKSTGAAFDKAGFSYFIEETFDLFYSGYLDSFTSLSGAIGMTQETDGGRNLRRYRDDNSILTLRDGVEHHFLSAMTVIRSAADARADLTKSFASFQKDTITADFSKDVKAYAFFGGARELGRMAEQLNRSGIQSTLSYGGEFNAPKATMFGQKDSAVLHRNGPWLYVSLAQSQGRFAKSILEPQANFEAEFVKKQMDAIEAAKKKEIEDYFPPDEDSFYDLAGWSLPYFYGVDSYTVSSAISPENLKPVKTAGEATGLSEADVSNAAGILWEYTDRDDLLGINDVLQKDVRVIVTNRPMEVSGKRFDRGQFVILRSRNEPGFEKVVIAAAQKRGGKIQVLPSSYPDTGRQSPGSESISGLKKTNVGVVFGVRGDLADVSGIWWLLERDMKIPFTPLRADALRSKALSKIDTLVVPSGASLTATDALKNWVREGGNLVVLGDADWAIGSSGFATLSQVDGNFRDIPVGIFQGTLDPRSDLSYGFATPAKGPIMVPVPYGGGSFYRGNSVGKFADDGKAKLLSGWSWPDDTDKAFAGATWVHEQRVGQGRVVIFVMDPTDRALWTGGQKLLLNAMYLR